MALVGFVAYLAVLGGLTLLPEEPGSDIDEVIDEVQKSPEAQTETDTNRISRRLERAANVALFVPLPILVAVAWPDRWWLGVPLAAALSISIELVQWVGLPDRSATGRDVVANVAGAVIGLALWLGQRRFTRWRRRPACG